MKTLERLREIAKNKLRVRENGDIVLDLDYKEVDADDLDAIIRLCGKKKSEITHLWLNGALARELDLRDFPKLKAINVANSRLKKLDISMFPEGTVNVTHYGMYYESFKIIGTPRERKAA